MTSYFDGLRNRLEGFFANYQTGFLSALLADLLVVRWSSAKEKMVCSLISDCKAENFESHHFLCLPKCQTWDSVAHMSRIRTFLIYRRICGVDPRYLQVDCEERNSLALQIVHFGDLPNVFSSVLLQRYVFKVIIGHNFLRYSGSELFDSK